MVVPAIEGIDLFNIAGRSISEWIASLKTGKTPTLVTSQRWAMEKTVWEVVGGESK